MCVYYSADFSYRSINKGAKEKMGKGVCQKKYFKKFIEFVSI